MIVPNSPLVSEITLSTFSLPGVTGEYCCYRYTTAVIDRFLEFAEMLQERRPELIFFDDPTEGRVLAFYIEADLYAYS